MLGIVAVVAIVGTSAYALLTANVDISGVNIVSETALLQINTPGGFNTTYAVNQTLNVYPGFVSGPHTATLRNASPTGINLKPSVQLTAATGDWDALKDKISIKIDDGATPVTKTLAELNAAPVELPGAVILSGADRDYLITITVDPTAGNEIAGKSLTNVTFALTGTQVVPGP